MAQQGNIKGNLALMDPAFKRDAFAYLTKDKIAAKSVVESIPDDFFEEDAEYDILFREFKEFVAKHGDRPRHHEFQDIIKDWAKSTGLSTADRAALLSAVESIWTHTNYTPSRVKDKLFEAVTVHHIYIAASQLPQYVDDGDYDGLLQAFARARVAGSDNAPLTEYWADTSERQKRRGSREKRRVTTGMDPLDDLTGGGVPPNSLSMIMGSSGHGKSALLMQLALSASQAGYKVGFITLELSQDQVMDRMDSNISGVPLDALPLKGKLITQKVVGKIKTVKTDTGKRPGQLFVQYYPTKSIGIHQIEDYLERLRHEQGVTLDVLFVDYFGLMKMTGDYKNKWEALEENCELLRGVAGKYDMAVWTADQTNRGGLDKEKVDMDDIAGSFGKVFPLDLMINISQTKDEKAIKVFRLYIAKSRLGPADAQVWIEPDFAKMRFPCYSEDEAKKRGLVKHKKRQQQGGGASQSMMGTSGP